MMESKYIIIISIIAIFSLSVIALGSFGLLSVAGWGNDLKNYTNEWRLQDATIGNEVTEAYLPLPKNTNEFSFVVDYGGEISTIYKSTIAGKISVKYEVFNYETNKYEIVHDKYWELKDDNSQGSSDLGFDGWLIYSNGIPEHLGSIQYSSCKYNRYLGCLDGMSVAKAQELSPWSPGKCTYTYYCVYPNNYYSERDYNDDEYDLEYFPNLITLTNKYIKDDNALFRITVDSKTTGLESFWQSDFDVDLWDIKTDLKTVYRFENNNCSEKSLMTYQTTTNDFDTLEECKANVVVSVYSYDDEDKSCSLKEKNTRDLTAKDYKTEEECLRSRNIVNVVIDFVKDNLKIIGAVSLLVLIIITFIFYVARRR